MVFFELVAGEALFLVTIFFVPGDFRAFFGEAGDAFLGEGAALVAGAFLDPLVVNSLERKPFFVGFFFCILLLLAIDVGLFSLKLPHPSPPIVEAKIPFVNRIVP